MPKLNTIVPRLVWSFYYLVELHNCNEYQHQPGLSIVSWVHGKPASDVAKPKANK